MRPGARGFYRPRGRTGDMSGTGRPGAAGPLLAHPLAQQPPTRPRLLPPSGDYPIVSFSGYLNSHMKSDF